MFFFSLRAKNIIKNISLCIFLAFVLAGLSYFAWLNHNDFEKTMVNQAQSQLSIIAKSEAQSIAKHISDINQQLKILSEENAIHKILKGGHSADIQQGPSSYLENSFKDVGRLADSLYLINPKGLVIGLCPFNRDIVGQDLSSIVDVRFMLANHKEYTSEISVTGQGGPIITHLCPVFEKGAFIGFLRVVISLTKIHDLVNHINLREKVFALILDDKQDLITFPDTAYIGKDIPTFLKQELPGSYAAGFKDIASRMVNGKEGVGVCQFLSEGYKSEIVKTLIAFVPIRIDSIRWSIAVALEYRAIADAIDKNARDNLIFMGFVLFVFIIMAIAVYRTQRKKDRLAISETALNIINKQLHLEIDERKRIEKEFQDLFTHGKK